MKTITERKARANLFKLLDDVSDSHEPIQISGKRASAVLLSAEEWRAYKRLCIFLLFRECVNRFVKAYDSN